MFLQLQYKEKNLKIKIEDQDKTYKKLLEIISKSFKIAPGSFKLSFIDVEGSLYQIQDDTDLEYFLEQGVIIQNKLETVLSIENVEEIKEEALNQVEKQE